MADQHELRGQEEREQGVVHRARGERAERDRQHGQRDGKRRAQQQAQQRGADRARDAAQHAFHGALPGGGEIGLQDEDQGQRHPVAVVDGEAARQGDGQRGADAHARKAWRRASDSSRRFWRSVFQACRAGAAAELDAAPAGSSAASNRACRTDWADCCSRSSTGMTLASSARARARGREVRADRRRSVPAVRAGDPPGARRRHRRCQRWHCIRWRSGARRGTGGRRHCVPASAARSIRAGRRRRPWR